jgi:hypothetical protein
MRKSPTFVLSIALAGLALGACQGESAKPAAPVVAAPAVPPPAVEPAAAAVRDAAGSDGVVKKSKLGPAPTDGLSLAERLERRKADETKLAAQLAADERQRLLSYDKTKLKLHTEVFAFIRKTRAAYDAAKNKAEVEKLRGKLEKPIVATGKKLRLIDPKGGNSNVVTDYDVMLNALANDYPQALAESFDGVQPPLGEQRAELDKRTKKIEDWLRILKGGK